MRTEEDTNTMLADLPSVREAKQRLVNWRAKLHAIEGSLFVRELFVCKPIIIRGILHDIQTTIR